MSSKIIINRRQALFGAAAIGGAFKAFPAIAQSPTTIRVGRIPGVVSDAIFLLAEQNGYFAEQGMKLEFTNFDGGSKIIAPLSVGQLDVAVGAPSAGMFNAWNRGIRLKVVADKGSSPPGFSYTTLIMRKELMDSGSVKDFGDLKGRTIALSGPAATPAAMLDVAMRQGGGTYSDVNIVYMGYPQMIAGLTNGAIDGGIMVEPAATRVITSGVGTRLWNDEVYPYQQIAVLLYGEQFANEQQELADGFMSAYIRGARDYNDALSGGKFTGEKGEQLLALLETYTKTDREVLTQMIPTGINPDGNVYLESLQKDYEFYKANGFIESGSASVEDIVDTSFVERALEKLGKYTKA